MPSRKPPATRARPAQNDKRAHRSDCAAVDVSDGSTLTGLTMFLVGVLFLAGFGIRLYGITDPPLTFHATRQFRSALIARGYYYATLDTVDEQRMRAAITAKERQGILEPPVMEWLACAVYRVSGGERLWLPRVMSALFWILGGVFLFLLAKRLASIGAASVSTAFYLFLPYSVEASRSFQPDPLMVMLFVGGILAIVSYFDGPSPRRLVVVVGVSAAAMFVKPVCLFPLYVTFTLLAMCAYGTRSFLRRWDFWLYVTSSVLPTVLYYVYGMFIGGFLRGQARASFLPHLLAKTFFWDGWLDKIAFVVGYPAFLAALVGLTLARAGTQRTLFAGLWLGYLCYGLIFNYHISTHDYYHLPFIPIAALSLAPLVELILDGLSRLYGARISRVAVGGLLVFGVLLSIHQADWRDTRPTTSQIVDMAQSVGEAVDHSDRTVFLAHRYGKPLQYYGGFAGVNWPDTNEQRAQRLRGRPRLSAHERFEEIREKHSVEFFVITNLRDFARQQDLSDFLWNEFPVLTQSDHYVIFDLRGGVGGE